MEYIACRARLTQRHQAISLMVLGLRSRVSFRKLWLIHCNVLHFIFSSMLAKILDFFPVGSISFDITFMLKQFNLQCQNVHSKDAWVSPQDSKIDVGLRSRQSYRKSEWSSSQHIFVEDVYWFAVDRTLFGSCFDRPIVECSCYILVVFCPGSVGLLSINVRIL